MKIKWQKPFVWLVGVFYFRFALGSGAWTQTPMHAKHMSYTVPQTQPLVLMFASFPILCKESESWVSYWTLSVSGGPGNKGGPDKRLSFKSSVHSPPPPSSLQKQPKLHTVPWRGKIKMKKFLAWQNWKGKWSQESGKMETQESLSDCTLDRTQTNRV